MQYRTGFWYASTIASCFASCLSVAPAAEPGLVGHWKLQGNCRDSSGQGNHGVNHGVDLANGAFSGAGAYIEVPSSDSLQLGTGNFSVCAHIYTEKELGDIIGDIVDKYDPAQRRGITLTIDSSASGYQSQGTDRHVHFGIDNAHTGDWQDCGRPNPTSNFVSNSMTVYQGKLYAATNDAEDQKDWSHVFRYEGGNKWTDCGRVGDRKTRGVGPMIVHDGDLYVATGNHDWTRVESDGYDPGRVYRYLGGTQWQDCGQPSDNRILNCIASYKGKLYIGASPKKYGVFTQADGNEWKPSIVFSRKDPHWLNPHAMRRFNGKLYVGYPGIYSFDGHEWKFVGDPAPDAMLQTHSMGIYQGKLCAGTWPAGKVATYEGGETWQEMGRVGEDGTEVQALTVYNGKLYGGSLPRAEVCRYDGASHWTSLKRFHSPEGWKPALPGKIKRHEVNEMGRLTGLAIHDGKLFASVGSCTGAYIDAPCDVRGKVFSMEAGKVASYDDDLGPGWKHLAAVREGNSLKLYIDGKLVAKSSAFNPAEYDVSTNRPLRIGFGQTDYFTGKLRDVRLYNRALDESEVKNIQNIDRPPSA